MSPDFSTIVVALALGIFAGCVFAVYQKAVLGTFVKKLIDNGCQDTESAKTLSELGIGKLYAFLLSASIKPCSVPARYISVLGDDKKNTDLLFEKKPERRFFIANEKKELVLQRYNTNGISALLVLTAFLLFVIVAFACFIFVPFLQNMVVGLFNNISNV